MGNNFIIVGNETLIDLRADTVAADKLLSGYTAHDKSGAGITGTLTPVQTGTEYFTSVNTCPNGKIVLNNIVGTPTNCIILRTDNGTTMDGGKVQKVWKLGTDTGQQYNGVSIIVNRNIPEGATWGCVTMTQSGTDLTIKWAEESTNYKMLGKYTWVVW